MTYGLLAGTLAPKETFPPPMKFPSDSDLLWVAQGSTRDAWLLRRVVYWHRYTQVEFNGYFWICKTQAEWAEETGLEERSVRRAFESMRDKGIVATEQHRFGSRTLNFTRLKAGPVKALGVQSG